MRFERPLVALLTKVLGRGASSRAAAAMLSSLLKLSGVRAEVALRNFARAFPDIGDDERRAYLAQTYEHLVWTGIEFIVLQRDPRAVLEMVESHNAELLARLYGGGAILLTGHVGNWELTAAWIAQSGYRVSAIVRESDDEGERDMIGTMREKVGVACIPKTAPMMRCVALLKRGEFLGILPDQHAGGQGIMVPYFGIKTSTSTGPAVFAHLTKRPLVPIFSHRVAPFRHVVRVGDPIEWEPMATRDETIEAITREVNASMEQMVREAPGQWLAQHRRFRELDR